MRQFTHPQAATVARVVTTMIGRRRKITREEMAGILGRLAAEGLDLANDCVEPGLDGPEGWAKRCRDICTVSVLADGATPHGQVRYDDPGSMHPQHHAAVLFAPSGLERGDHDQLGYLRRHADRVLIVQDDPVSAPSAEDE